MTSLSLCHRIYVQILVTCLHVLAWSQNPSPKHTFRQNEFESQSFLGNTSAKDKNYFKVLHQEYNSILVGARNTLYNISVHNLSEVTSQKIFWPPLTPHKDLCHLKGKSEDDCQNYIRVGAKTDDGSLLVCGTNAYRPSCKKYINQEGVLTSQDKEIEGPGRCPFSPSHNSTALFTDGHLYTATVADFSGGEPLIYREPQRTERSDLKQLNDPNFVSSMSYQNYVLFFFREPAVEYINCGKAVYSRVARVCKSDKGGPHMFRDRWTTFLKSRLNCSVPGDYPFYFDEIQATSEIIQGEYGDSQYDELIYGVFNTPVNSIGGSAICAFSMRQLMATFDGPFKEQDGMNANWLPVPHGKVPEPRPGPCVNDSRTLPDSTVNFVKTHSLMNDAVPSHFSQPVSIKVSWSSKYSAIAVDPQVRALSGNTYDVLFVGTEDGKVVKMVNIVRGGEGTVTHAHLVEELQVLPPGTPVTSLNIVRTASYSHAKLLVVSNSQLTTVALHRCKVFSTCSDCVHLQDPYCAWDLKLRKCVPYQERSLLNQSQFVQSIERPSSAQCPRPEYDLSGDLTGVDENNELDNQISDVNSEVDSKECSQVKCPSCVGQCADSISQQASQQDKIVIYTGNTLGITVLTSVILTLLIGFTAGYLCSRYIRHDAYTNMMPFQTHQQLNRLDNSTNFEAGGVGGGASSFLASPNNKNALNLVMNVCHEAERAPKNDLNEKNSTLENNKTLQKVKKTYI